jgi:hypothetical protein
MVAGTITNLCRNGKLVSLSKRSFYPFLFFLFLSLFSVSPRGIGDLVRMRGTFEL